MHSFHHQIRVRYAECDSMGFAHHSVYALYFEEARTEVMRHMGFSYRELESSGILMPVRSMSYHFVKAALYDDLLDIEVTLSQASGIRCLFAYKTTNQHGELLNTGETELFFVKKDGLRPMKLPEQFSKLFKNA